MKKTSSKTIYWHWNQCFIIENKNRKGFTCKPSTKIKIKLLGENFQKLIITVFELQRVLAIITIEWILKVS